ncbi:MAG: sensor histidine kinase, partial [Oscillospiraceae bacterium]|nr:sensor histidine kinase [Oscillospiraceae bacterium]
MKRKINVKKLLFSINNWCVFFLLVAFVVTCCMMLFVTVLSKSLGVELTDQNLNAAAKLTFINVIFLSILFSVIDAIRRKFTTDRITKRIAE